MKQYWHPDGVAYACVLSFLGGMLVMYWLGS